MKLDITIDHYQALIKKGFSLDILHMVNFIHEGLDVHAACESSVKIKTIYNTMTRKGLITDDGKLTSLSVELLDFVSKKTNKVFEKKKTDVTEFEKWWSIFPSTDYFTEGGKKFTGGRGLRVNKQRCKLEFDKIVSEGEISAEQIISGTTFDVWQRKKNSVKKNENQITYMQNSLTYLNQKSFEPFMDMSGEWLTAPVSRKGSFDI